MKLTPEQETALRQWAADGCTLSDLQSRIVSEFNLHPSYMDVRFLVLDLGITLSERPKPNPVDLAKAPAPAPQAPAGNDLPGTPYDDGLSPEEDSDDTLPEDSLPPPPQEPAEPNVSVEVSRLAQPGFALNGTVTFTDGTQCTWGVTARGELSLEPKDPAMDTYRPTPEDIRAFQVELRRAITRMGY